MHRFAALCLALVSPIALASTQLQGFSVTGSTPSDVFLTAGTQTNPDSLHTAWPVTINSALLSSLPVSVNLNFPDRSAAVLTKMRSQAHGTGSYLWTGRGNGCTALFSATPANFRGVISCSNAAYGVEATGPESSALSLSRLDPSSSAPTEPKDVPESFGSASTFTPMTTTTPCGTAIPTSDPAIDILVVFNEKVRLALDSGTNTANTVKFAHDAVDLLQLAMDDSTYTFGTPGVAPIATVNFVGAHEITRTDSGNSILDLGWMLTAPEIAAYRTFYGADAVIYLVETAGTAIGVSYEPDYNNLYPFPGPDFSPYAMSVVQRNKAMNE